MPNTFTGTTSSSPEFCHHRPRLGTVVSPEGCEFSLVAWADGDVEKRLHRGVLKNAMWNDEIIALLLERDEIQP